jgi:light-regulated signal transduction histidine kinase (bacteriophytochrome)
MSTAEHNLRVDLATCESEPIHIPGFIPPHDVLLALNSTTFIIEQVSENLERLLAIAPHVLIGKSPALFLGDRQFEPVARSSSGPAFETGVTDVLVGPASRWSVFILAITTHFSSNSSRQAQLMISSMPH